MSRWSIDVQVLFEGDAYSNASVELWMKWKNLTLGISDSLYHLEASTDESGHATFEVGDFGGDDDDDADDGLDDDTPIVIRVVHDSDNYEFGPYTLGESGYTVNIDPGEGPESVDL